MSFNKSISRKQASGKKLMPAAERRRNPRFTIMFHPSDWYWDLDEKEWLPNISKMNMEPGCNGIDASGDLSIARNMYVQRGFHILENGDTRVGCLDEGYYLASYDAQRGKVYKETWYEPEELSLIHYWVRNDDVYFEFLKDVKKNILPAMATRAKQELIKRQQKRVDRLTNAVLTAPSVKGQLDAELERLEGMKADLGANTAPPGRRRRTKTPKN